MPDLETGGPTRMSSGYYAGVGIRERGVGDDQGP